MSQVNLTSSAVNSSPRVPRHARPQLDHPVLAVVGDGVPGRQRRHQLLVLPALIFVEAVVDGAEDVRFVVADRVHRDQRRRRRPGRERRGRIAAGALDRPVLRLRIEHRVEGRGVEPFQLRVHGDHVLRIEQDRHRLDVVPALLERVVSRPSAAVVGSIDADDRRRPCRCTGSFDVVEILARWAGSACCGTACSASA